MNRIIRMLTITGLGLVAGTTIGAGPAMAATGTGQTATPSATTTQSSERVVGFYRNLRSCVVAGRIGERFGRWDDFDCERVRWGMHRGAWALEVSWDDDDDWDGPWWPNGGHHGGGHHGGGHQGGGHQGGGHHGGPLGGGDHDNDDDRGDGHHGDGPRR